MPHDRTTKAERARAKTTLADARRRAASGTEDADRWARIARRGIGEHARLSRRRPTTWWFRGDVVPETTGAGRDGRSRLRIAANPNGAFAVTVAADGAELPAPPRHKPAWSIEAKVHDVDPAVLRLLFPGPPVLNADPLRRLGSLQ